MAVSISLAALSNAIQVTVSNTASVDRNEVWRSRNSEAAKRLTKTLGEDGVFTDYGVASEVEYTYFAREVISGVETQSTVASLSITLTECWLHMNDKTQATTQLSGTSLIIDNLPGQLRGPSRSTAIYMTGGRTKPTSSASDIEDQSLQVTLRFADDADLESIQEIYDSKRYVCLRDQQGLVMFGTLIAMPISYQFGFSDVSFLLEETDFSEHVD
jgi:hypothetical protein